MTETQGTLLQHAEEATGSMRQEIRIVGTELTLAGDRGSRGINLCPQAYTGSQWDQEPTTTIRDFAFCPWPPPVRPEGHQGLTSSGRLTMAGKQLLGSDSYTRLFLLSSISPGYSADYGQTNNFPLGKIKQNEKLQAAGWINSWMSPSLHMTAWLFLLSVSGKSEQVVIRISVWRDIAWFGLLDFMLIPGEGVLFETLGQGNRT